MKLYWPMAKCVDGEGLHTYDNYLNLEDCKKTFRCWENGYHYNIASMYVVISDTDDPDYHVVVHVERDYKFYTEGAGADDNGANSHIALCRDTHLNGSDI